MDAAKKQLALERAGQSRFARAGEPCEPNDRAAMSHPQGAIARGDFTFHPEDIFALGLGAAIGINAAADGAAAADAPVIDDHESAQRRDALVIIHYQRAAGLNRDPADFIA